MAKKIIILYSCNLWKNNNSMGVKMASTSEAKIRKEIAYQINKNSMTYDRDNLDDIQVLNIPLLELNTLLGFGYIEVIEDGERQ